MSDRHSAVLLEDLFFSSIRMYNSENADGLLLSKRTIQKYAICFITNGKGVLTINEFTHTAQKGDLFFLLPGMIVEGASQALDPIHYSVIFFSCFQMKKHQLHSLLTALMTTTPSHKQEPELLESLTNIEKHSNDSRLGPHWSVSRFLTWHAYLASNFAICSRTRGATSVPSSSMAFITSSCGIVPTGKCKKNREKPKCLLMWTILLATVSGSPT